MLNPPTAVKRVQSVQSACTPNRLSTQKLAWMPAAMPFMDWLQNDARPLTRSPQCGSPKPMLALPERQMPPPRLNQAEACTCSAAKSASALAEISTGPFRLPM